MRHRIGSHVREEPLAMFARAMNNSRGLKPPWTSREQGRLYGAWRGAEAVLRPSVPDTGPVMIERKYQQRVIAPHSLAHETVRRFNRLVQATGAAPHIWSTRGEPQARLTYPSFSYRDEIVTSACKRLKLCGTCDRWFADSTRSNGARWCSSRCRDRAWNRQRRRAAGHKQYQPRSKRRPNSSRPKPAVQSFPGRARLT
jgi:hypothetical protein